MNTSTTSRYIGTYEITGAVGVGSFGQVFSAYQPFLDRKVAIKTLHNELFEEGFSEKLFIREGRVIARLRHPNIVHVYEFGTAQDSATNTRAAFMVMEHLPGGTLQQKMLEDKLSHEEMINLLGQIAQGLTYAHEQNVIHMDLKPTNILFTADGQPVIVDFGLAKMAEGVLFDVPANVLTPVSTGESTIINRVIGTPRYMSPEQLQNLPVTPATDQYALALIAFQMLTGKIPLDGENPTLILTARAYQPAPSILQYAPDLPPAVAPVFARGLALDPADRYPNAVEFVNALTEALLPNHTPEKIVRVIDPVQAIQVATARQYMKRFLGAVGLVMLIIIFYCGAEFLRGYSRGAFPEFMWDGLIVSGLKTADNTRVINGVMPGSLGETAGYRIGDRIYDDLILDKNNPSAQFRVDGIPRALLNTDWKPKPGDVVEREVMRSNGSSVTLSYTLQPNIYSLYILAATVFSAVVGVCCGFWMLWRWGPEPIMQIYIPLTYLFGVFIVGRAVTNLVLYMDTLTFHLLLAVTLHLIIVFPKPMAWVEKHPRRLWLIYAPVLVGLCFFLFQTPIVIPIINLPLQALDYVVYILVILFLMIYKWVRRDLKLHPGLRWVLFSFMFGMGLSLYYVVVFYLISAETLNSVFGGAVLQTFLNDIFLVIMQAVVPVMGTYGAHLVQKQFSADAPRILVAQETPSQRFRKA